MLDRHGLISLSGLERNQAILFSLGLQWFTFLINNHGVRVEIVRGIRGLVNLGKTLHPWAHSLIQDFRHEIEDAFIQSRERTSQPSTSSTFRPIEVSRDGNEYVVKVDLPGVDPKELDVSVSGNVVTLRSSRNHHDKQGSWDVVYCELMHGDFERKLRLPQGIVAEDIRAIYSHGVLELRMPTPKETATRNVPIEFDTMKVTKS